MPNPYQPAANAPRVVYDEPRPTLDLDGGTGPELKKDLPSAPDSGVGVPHGTIKEIMDWVGDSPSRAVEAAKVEHARGDARPTLIYRLKRVRDK